MKAKVTVYCTDGGGAYGVDAVVIRKVDVLRIHDYARENCCLRDYLFVRLPMKIGLRTGEICTLNIENINFENRRFFVLDSKRKNLYPLPLDPVTLQLIQDLIDNRQEGYVFTRNVYSRSWSHKREGEPLDVSTVWLATKRIGEAAGVKGFHPRILRAYFALDFLKRGLDEGKDREFVMQSLQVIMRHKRLDYLEFYLRRLVFFEDIEDTYQRIQAGPFQPEQLGKTEPALSPACSVCGNLAVCRFAEKMPSWATGCRFQKQKVNEIE